MAKLRRIFTSFISGEWSLAAMGRVDLDKYFRAAETIENYIILNTGAVTRRPGYRFVVKTKFQDGKRTRVYFMPSTAGDGYVLEIGHLYLRFIYDGVQLEDPDSPGDPLELVTPYSNTDVFDLHFAQIGDVMYIANPNYDPYKLVNNDGTFTLSKIKFNPPPTAPISLIPTASITPGATTGDGVVFTASGATFTLANENQIINNLSGPGRASITTFTDSTHVTADITEDFPSTSAILSPNWSITGPANATLTPSASSGDANKPVGKIITLTLDNAYWTSDMVGMFVRLNLGMVKITKFTSSTVVKAQILGEMTVDDPAGPGTWTIESDAWLNNPPDTVCFHEDRLWFARGFQFWGSRVDDFENFTPGANDDDAVSFTIATGDQIADIKWMLSAEELLFGTATQEIKASGGTNQPITASNVNVKPMDSFGSTNIQAIKHGQAAIFVERGHSKIREMEFDLQSNSFVSRNLILLADHITKGGITQWARQKRPYEVIWFVNGNGENCGLHLDYVEQVLGWDRQKLSDAA